MSDLINSIIETRQTASKIAAEVLLNINNTSEIEIHKLVLSKMSAYNNIFPTGWYDPPPGGVSVLFDQALLSAYCMTH